jgi:hypothetical protein
MRVEDRLRQGLEANATSFVPDGEWRLAQVRRRRRRRRSTTVLAAGLAAAVVLGSALVAGRGELLPGPAHPSPAAGEPSVLAGDGPVVPDGTWHRVATEAEAAALGVPRRDVVRHLGDDGRLPLALTVVGDTWAITTTSDAGAVEVGDLGHATYDEQGRLVTTSASSGCPGCEAVLAWRVEGDDLVVKAADGLDAVERLMTEGRWRDREPLVSTTVTAGGCSSTRGRPAGEEDTMDRNLYRNIVVALAALAALATGCSDDGDQDAAASPEGEAEPAGGTSPPRVDEAGWDRETTEARARELGLSQRTIDRYVGKDGVLPLGMKLQQQTYILYVVDDDDEARPYDLGGYSYDDEGRLLLSSSSGGCDDCATVLTWEQDGKWLVVDEVEGRGTTPLDRFVWEGEWWEGYDG